ncbi:MAG TPA: hypothetical protein PKO15_10180 [Fibrobacteria bacterium]|nr:hypothetical protein [Fibrobacteria bacterium]HOX53206.1 hypothetical protein [Fibrobacteria bacterium]
MRLLFASALLAVSAQAIEIVPPSPYMSSEPPAMMDTTQLDPMRRPKCLVVEPGIKEAWYDGWNLTSDQPTSNDLELRAARKGKPTVRVEFNDRGWPVEVMYHDANRNVRWTKLLRYPANIPSGPGDVPYTVNWISSQGQAIPMAKIAAAFKSTSWKVGMTKYQVGDILGEPLIVEVGQGGFSGKPETRIYSIDNKEVRFSFNADNKLTALPEEIKGIAGPTPPKPAPLPPKEEPKPVKPADPAPVKVDTVKKVEPVAPKAPVPLVDTTKMPEVPDPVPTVVDTSKKVAPAVDTSAKPVTKVKCKKGKKCKEPKVVAPKPAKPAAAAPKKTKPAKPGKSKKLPKADSAKVVK